MIILNLTWFGQSCFLLESNNGKKILTDPFDTTLGYKSYSGAVDVVTISHHHFDHDYVKNLPENTIIFDKPGAYKYENIEIIGFPSYHDNLKGAARGKNTIFTFKMDNLKICHLGDLGYILSEDEINSLGNIDVLLIPVGGNFTIDGDEAAKLCKKINSKIVIPMHYKTPLTSLPIDGVDKFILNMKNGEKLHESKLVIKENLRGNNRVLIPTI
ncbi:MBL fold metallo-hydrolase [Clostridium guangxiense]|uniref:MBL fold metallo-hydrolase n=1 Tax=Clostridium guangxiense TaxID=1662055 RepID=UPI002EDA5FD8